MFWLSIQLNYDKGRWFRRNLALDTWEQIYRRQVAKKRGLQTGLRLPPQSSTTLFLAAVQSDKIEHYQIQPNRQLPDLKIGYRIPSELRRYDTPIFVWNRVYLKSCAGKWPLWKLSWKIARPFKPPFLRLQDVYSRTIINKDEKFCDPLWSWPTCRNA